MASAEISQYHKYIDLQNVSGSGDPSAAPEGGIYLFASGAAGSAKLYLQNEGVGTPLSLADGGTLQIAGDSGTDTVNMASDTFTFAGGEGVVSAVTDNQVSLAVSIADFSSELSSATVADTDEFAISDGGTMKKIDFQHVRDSVFADVSGDATIAAGGALTIAAQAVENSMLADDAVGADELAANAVVNASVVDGSLKADKLDLDGSTDIGADLVDADLMIVDDGAGGTNRVSALSRVKKYIYSAMSGDATASDSGALTIANAAVEHAMLANDAVDGDNIADDSVNSEHIVLGALDAEHYSSGSIQNGHLAGSIANAKLSNSAVTVTAGDGLKDGGSVALGASVTLNIEPNDFAGAGLEDDGSDNLRIAAAAAGVGLTGGGGSALALDLNELGDTPLAVGADSIVFIDADDNSSKKEAFADVVANMAGSGLAASAGVLSADLSELSDAAVASGDKFVFVDATDDSTKMESIDDMATFMAGAGLAASSGVLAINIDEFSAKGDASLHQTDDKFLVSDGGTEKTITFSNLEDAIFGNVSGDASIAAGGAVTLAAAQTNVTSLLATDIKIGEDDQTKIDFETANEIHFYADNAEQVFVADGVFGPQTDSDVNLGADGTAFKKLFVDDIDLNGQGRIDLDVDGDTSIRSAADDQIQLEVGGTDMVTVLASGVGINGGYGNGSGTGMSFGADGTINADSNLNLGANTAGASLIVYGAANNERMMYDKDTHTLSFRNSGGTMLTLGGDADTEYALDVANGTDNINKVRAAAFVTYSDESLKSDVETMNTALDTVMSLNGVEFTWKDSGERDFGFIAQDVQSVLPKAVHVAEDGVQGVDYSRLTSVLVEAVKAQQIQIEELKALLKK